jgi:HK97 family phage prohead protease
MDLLYEFKEYEIKEDDDNYIIEGYGSIAQNVDLGNDIVANGAFTDDLMSRDNGVRPALWQHNSREPVGIVESREDSKGLYSKFRLPKSDTFVSGRVMPQVRVKSVTGLSIGYDVIDSEMMERDGKRCRLLKKLKLYEISLVTFPMNEEARIMAAKEYLLAHDVKSLEEEHKTVPPYKNYSLMDSGVSWEKSKAVKQIKDKTGSGDGPSASYKNGFMYYDPENEDNFGGYKLPYVYVEEGSFKAVPRAIFAIAAALSGARGGVNIPDADKSKIKAQINKYYKKMDKEPPFKGDKSYIDINTIKAFGKRDYIKLIEEDNGIILSSSAKDFVADMIFHAVEQRENEESVKKSDIINELKELNKQIDNSLKGERQ